MLYIGVGRNYSLVRCSYRLFFYITAAEDVKTSLDSFEVIVVMLCSLKKSYFSKQFRLKIPLFGNRKIKNVNYNLFKGT